MQGLPRRVQVEGLPLLRQGSGSGRRVIVAGATGYLGQAVTRHLADAGYAVTALVRPGSRSRGLQASRQFAGRFPGVRVVEACLAERDKPAPLPGEQHDAVVSCLASRSGEPADAWRVDYGANLRLLDVARRTGAGRFVLLSAICVQKPRLAFQHAKLAFEAVLEASTGLGWNIVRPTAFFKSLSGQVGRVLSGKPFLLFGDGRLTACKPIAEEDLAAFLCRCLEDPALDRRVLPIGGPGPALSPREQGELLFELSGRPARFRSVSPGLLSGIACGLGFAGRIVPGLAAKAELARIGHYYATESMLVLDPKSGEYSASATPEAGSITLRDHYRRLLREGMAGQELGAHAVFSRREPYQ